MRGIVTASLAVLAQVFLLAWAQQGFVGPNVTRSYDIRELSVRPGLIYVSPTYSTLLEFDDVVIRVASARGDLLAAEVKDNYVYLRAITGASGSGDLWVTVADGRIAMFRVQVDKNATGPRRYVIRMPAMTPETGGRGEAPAPATRVEVAPSRTPAVPSPTPSPAPSLPSLGPTPTQVLEEMPPYLQVRAGALWDSNILSVNLLIRNGGTNSVVADPAAVRVYALDDKGQRTVLPIQVAGGGRVPPGGSLSVAVTTFEAPEMVEVVWRVTEIGVAKVWTYRTVLRRDSR